MKCKICKAEAVVALRSHNAAFCPACYKDFFARQVARGIEGQGLFTREERVLVALSGLSAVVVWIAIAYCQIVFRRRWLESGHSTSELKYRTPGYPYVSWAAFILCTASFVLVIFDVEQRFALVAELVFIVACYGAYFLQQWVRKRKKATEADDLDTLWVARD